MFKDVLGKNMEINVDTMIVKVSSGKFVGFIVSSKGIQANLEKIQAFLDIPSLWKHKDLKSLVEGMERSSVMKMPSIN
uniref:Uncharacterized protein n=1 Tax=Cannabis sativa TaxID=3483 RepID=A0A803QQX1_CANSA